MAPNTITANYFGNSRVDINKWLSFIENNISLDLHSTIPEYEIILFNYFCFESFFYRTHFNIIRIYCLFVLIWNRKLPIALICCYLALFPRFSNVRAVMGNIGERERNRKYNCLLKIVNEIYMLDVYHWALAFKSKLQWQKICARRSRGKKKERNKSRNAKNWFSLNYWFWRLLCSVSW